MLAINDKMTTIGFVDRSPMLAKSFEKLFDDDDRFACQAIDLGNFLHSNQPFVAEKYDVLIMDPSDFEYSVAESLRAFPGDLTNTKLVSYSFDNSPESMALAIDAGFCSFLSKDSEPEHLVYAMHCIISEGIVVCSPDFQEAIRTSSHFSQAGLAGENSVLSVLSMQEAKVLNEYAQGASLKQISKTLSLSEKTVHTYKTRAARKLGLSDRQSIFRFAFENGLVGPSKHKP